VKPATAWPPAAVARLRVLLCDIDGTMTSDGRLGSAAYRAMERLQDGGVQVVPVTGRPAGWCDMIARFWPVSAVVGENGAFYFRYDHAAKRMIRAWARDHAQREHDRARLAEIGAEVLKQVPGTALAADQRYREADVAIDWCEDVPALPAAEVQRIVDLLHRHGLTVKVSSIHVNAWFGAYDKLTMTRRLLREQFDIDVDSRRDGVAFVGDSPNDEPMFAFFPNSVAVANIAAFADAITHEPAYVTRGAEGRGFAELARLILSRRRAAGRQQA
jgi:HAD superfamily hydrolase (TIGR01484 family)